MKTFLLPGLLLLLSLAACTSEPAKSTEPAVKPPDFLAGRSAFQKMYVASRGWARDAQGFSLMSVLTSDSKGHDGKAGVWRATFASATQRTSKPYIWCGTNTADVDRGVTWGAEDSYNASNSSTHVFDIAFLKTDSDDAYQTALKHGGDKLLEKDANQPVIYLLDWDGPSNTLVWHVIFGASRTDYQLAVMINASTGEFIRMEK